MLPLHLCTPSHMAAQEAERSWGLGQQMEAAALALQVDAALWDDLLDDTAAVLAGI
jgi:hypothetical protein